MNNTEHFGKLTERMQAFREEVLDAKPYIDAQRAVLATEAYKSFNATEDLRRNEHLH